MQNQRANIERGWRSMEFVYLGKDNEKKSPLDVCAAALVCRGDASGFLPSHLDVDFIYCYSLYGTPREQQVHPFVRVLLNE